MKKNIFRLLLAIMVLPLLASCSKEEIVFDLDRQFFPTREGYQLLEVVVPTNTPTNDEIYIVGDFNGGEDAIGNPLWQLQKSDENDLKWGIYINPSDLQDGKTLADGYYFYSKQNGKEAAINNMEVKHTECPAVGGWANVMVNRWEVRSDDEPVVEHDGYAVFVIDNTGWDALALYAWGNDLPELFGGWPGAQPTGTQMINGTEWTYFDTGADNAGLEYNLIFNNNGNGSQLGDFNFTLTRDLYLQITPDGAVEVDPNNFSGDEVVEHDGPVVFVYNSTSWDEFALYMWGDVNDLNGSWPGMLPTGTQKKSGKTWTYFDMGAANEGLAENLIFNNNGNGEQLGDYAWTLSGEIYLELTPDGAVLIEDPANFTPGQGGGGNDDPTPDDPTPVVEKNTYHVYVENATGWDNVELYAWGEGYDDTKLCGGWGGLTSTRTQTIQGVEYLVFTIKTEYENPTGLHFIFHNGDEKLNPEDVVVDLNEDLFIKISKEEGAVKKLKKKVVIKKRIIRH